MLGVFERRLGVLGFRQWIEDNLLDDESPVDFELWAFGVEHYGFKHSMDYMEAWNVKHGEKKKLECDDCIDCCLVEMVKLWREKDGIL